MLRQTARFAGLGAALVLATIQFYQPNRSNPPVDVAADFKTVANPHPEVAAAIGRACRDCHSHNTVWPWYSRVSPVSWLIASDVRRGRTHLNFSEWNRYSVEMSNLRLAEACEAVRSGEMPPWYYALLHPQARFSPREHSAICAAPQVSR